MSCRDAKVSQNDLSPFDRLSQWDLMNMCMQMSPMTLASFEKVNSWCGKTVSANNLWDWEYRKLFGRRRDRLAADASSTSTSVATRQRQHVDQLYHSPPWSKRRACVLFDAVQQEPDIARQVMNLGCQNVLALSDDRAMYASHVGCIGIVEYVTCGDKAPALVDKFYRLVSEGCVWRLERHSQFHVLASGIKRDMLLCDVNKLQVGARWNTVEIPLCHTSRRDAVFVGCLDGSLTMIDTRSRDKAQKLNSGNNGPPIISIGLPLSSRSDIDGDLILVGSTNRSIMTFDRRYLSRSVQHTSIGCEPSVMIMGHDNLHIVCGNDGTAFRVSTDSVTPTRLIDRRPVIQHESSITAAVLHHGVLFTICSQDSSISCSSAVTLEPFHQVRLDSVDSTVGNFSMSLADQVLWVVKDRFMLKRIKFKLGNSY